MAIFIDDLDRCSKENVVEILETINFLAMPVSSPDTARALLSPQTADPTSRIEQMLTIFEKSVKKYGPVFCLAGLALMAWYLKDIFTVKIQPAEETPMEELFVFTILRGDNPLTEGFRSADLLPLGSRIGSQIVLEPLFPEQLRNYLSFALDLALNHNLMSRELFHTLTEHAANNLRVLNQMATELLNAVAQQDLPRIDESLVFQLFSPTRSKPRINRQGNL